MKKTHFLMALLTLFRSSSPTNAVEAITSHEGLEARVSEYWVVDDETSTVTNNEKLCEGRNFTEDQLTTIFNDLGAYLRNPARNDYKINISQNFLFGYREKYINFLPIAKFVHTIGDIFLCESNLEQLDMTGLVKLQKIGNYFVANVVTLKTFNATGSENLTKIGEYFLFNSKSLEFIDTIWLVNVQQIGRGFMWNTALTSFDRTNLVNLVMVGRDFLYNAPFLRENKTYNKFLYDMNRLVGANRLISAGETLRIENLPGNKLTLRAVILAQPQVLDQNTVKFIRQKGRFVREESGTVQFSSREISQLTKLTWHWRKITDTDRPYWFWQKIDEFLAAPDESILDICNLKGPRIRRFVLRQCQRVLRQDQVPETFEAQLDMLVKDWQTRNVIQLQPGTEEQKKEQENKEAEQQQRQNQEEETKEEPPRKRMLKQDGSANK